MRVLRFLVSGAVGISVNLALFHTLYVRGVPYLLGSAIAFSVALVVGFALQKFWTFERREWQGTHAQFAQYAALALGNLAVNTGIVYLLVEYARAYYLVAQTVGAGLVACTSFFVYNLYIFATRS